MVLNGLVGIDGEEEEEEDAISSWTTPNNNNQIQTKEYDFTMPVTSISTFKSMLDADWYVNPTMNNQDPQLGFCVDKNTTHNLFIQHHSLDSSASSSPSQPFRLETHPFLPPKSSCFSSLLFNNNPFDNHNYNNNVFNFASGTAFLTQFQPNDAPNLMGFSNPEFSSSLDFQATTTTRLFTPTETQNVSPLSGFEGFDVSGNAVFMNRAKLLKPLEVFPSVGSQPTLFQKRAAMRQGSGGVADKLGVSGDPSDGKRKRRGLGETEEDIIDISGLNYDSDDCKLDESGNNSNATSTLNAGADNKGKKKGMPAKNLMAERRRRKKVNDRLYMLRSVVPRISKMDRASILGDAVDYLKELLQRINDLHTELESTPPGSFTPPSTSLYPLTPTAPILPGRVKEELCPSSFLSPKSQPAKVEVRAREGRAVNIHMFCAHRPGLLLSTMRALDNLGLDIKQAVISCFNGFALDVFRAEQCSEGQDVLPEQIKAVLLDSAGFHGIL